MTLYVVDCMNSVNLFQMAYFAMARKGEVSRRALWVLKTRDADDADAGYPKADPRWDLGVPSARPFPVADQWSFMWFNCNCLIVDTTYDYIYIHGVVLMHVVPYRSFEIWDHTLHLRAFLGFRTIQHICPTEQAISDGTIPKWPYIVLGWWIIIGYPGLLFSVWFEMGMGRASLQSDLHMIL